MPAVIRTRLEAILPLLRARLVSATGLPESRVLGVQRDDLPFDAHGDGYVYLRIEDGDFDDANIRGAGRIDAREELPFAVVVRTRLATDEANQDYRWMLDHAALRRKVLDAMLCFQPTDVGGNWLVTEPIKPARSRRPRKNEGKDKANKEWGQSALYFVMTYEMDLTQTYQ